MKKFILLALVITSISLPVYAFENFSTISVILLTYKEIDDRPSLGTPNAWKRIKAAIQLECRGNSQEKEGEILGTIICKGKMAFSYCATSCGKYPVASRPSCQ